MTTEQRPIPSIRGRRDGWSLAPAIVPLGLGVGVALAETSVSPLLAWAGAPLLVAGAAHVVLVTELDTGASALAAAAAALVVNARFVVYGAALAPRFRGAPRRFRWLAAHVVVDQTYALTSQQVDRSEPDEAFRAYFASAALRMLAIWTVSVGAGILVGSRLPDGMPLDLVLPVMFVALLVPGLSSRRQAVVASVGAIVVLGGATGIPAVVGAAAVGAGIGWRQVEDR